jgi:hypothetical protein
MARDEEAIRRSRLQSFDEVLAQFTGASMADPEVRRERADYIANGWRPTGPKVLYQRGETPRQRR